LFHSAARRRAHRVATAPCKRRGAIFIRSRAGTTADGVATRATFRTGRRIARIVFVLYFVRDIALNVAAGFAGLCLVRDSGHGEGKDYRTTA
jgi:hypothetical protein